MKDKPRKKNKKTTLKWRSYNQLMLRMGRLIMYCAIEVNETKKCVRIIQFVVIDVIKMTKGHHTIWSFDSFFVEVFCFGNNQVINRNYLFRTSEYLIYGYWLSWEWKYIPMGTNKVTTIRSDWIIRTLFWDKFKVQRAHNSPKLRQRTIPEIQYNSVTSIVKITPIE